MGVFSDLLANVKTVDVDLPRMGEDRAEYQAILGLKERLGDPDYPAGYDAENEVQSIGEATGANDGTYTLEFTLHTGESFTTAALNHDDNAAAIESAIDTAAVGVAGWTNGDITVSGGPLDSDDVTLTFDGGSVSGQNHPLLVVNDALLIGGSAGVVVSMNEGQTPRTSWAALRLAGVVADVPPPQGTSGVVTRDTTPQTNPYYPDQGLIRALAASAAIEDGNADVESSILEAVGLE